MASTPPASDPDTDEAPDAPDATPPQEEAPAAGAKREPRFFRWIRTFGLVRRSGWLGGVCAAVAERTRLDPILVRGIVVVLAVLGAPIVLVYAAAWFLLPDEKGAIHALTLARGRVEGAVVAIAALVLASFLPLTQGFWWVGAAYWGEPDFTASAGRILWTALVIAAGVVLVVWLARRAAQPDIRTVPATTDDKPETVPRPAEAAETPRDGVVAIAAGPDAAAIAPPPAAPTAPGSGASDGELAAWKAQQEAWKQQRSTWAARQRADDRARRAAAQAAWAQQREAQLAERRRREPWIGGAAIGIVLGLALIAGAGVGMAASFTAPNGAVGWPAGLAAAAAVFGLGLAIAGIARRRAGALAALAVLSLVGAAATVPLAADRQLVPWVGGYSLDTTHSGRYARIGGGETFLSFSTTPRSSATTVDLWQAAGAVDVLVQEHETIRIMATLHDGDMRRRDLQADGNTVLGPAYRPNSTRDGVAHYDLVYGEGTPDVTLRLDLLRGSVQITTVPPVQPAPTPSPTFSPAPTEGATP